MTMALSLIFSLTVVSQLPVIIAKKTSNEFLSSAFVVDFAVLSLILVLFIQFLYSGIVEKGWGFLSYSEFDESFNIYSYMILLSYSSVMFIISSTRLFRHKETARVFKRECLTITKKIDSLNRANKKIESEINNIDKQIQKISKPLLKKEERILELKKDISSEKKLFATLKKKYSFSSSFKIIGNR
tara:strand:- start:678 stop:1235 length:558 start_codon:yes stop_codon:yes gene_type:complete